MCEFKFCRGSGTCFLSKTSPCAGFEASQPKRDRPRSIRMRYEGFLDQDALLAVLEPANDTAQVREPVAENASGKLGSFVRAAPRFLRGNNDKTTDSSAA